MDKFGWLKWKSNRIYFPPVQKSELKSRFSYTYTHCNNDELIWQFHGRYSNKEFEKIKHTSLEEKVSTRIASIESKERLMIATLTSSPRLNVFLEIKETADVVFYYDKSQLTDFSVCLQIDKFSNRFLNVSLVGASGSLIGFLRVETIPIMITIFHFMWIQLKKWTQYPTHVSLAIFCLKKLSKMFLPMSVYAHWTKDYPFVKRLMWSGNHSRTSCSPTGPLITSQEVKEMWLLRAHSGIPLVTFSSTLIQ